MGQVNVNGGGDSDVVNIDDSGDEEGDSGTLTSSAVTGLGLGAGVTYTQVENLNIVLGSGNDLFNVQGTNAGATTVLTTGGGMNTINVGSTASGVGSVVDNVQGPLVLIGSGVDILNVNDSGSTVGKTGQLTPNTITGLGMGSGNQL